MAVMRSWACSWTRRSGRFVHDRTWRRRPLNPCSIAAISFRCMLKDQQTENQEDYGSLADHFHLALVSWQLSCREEHGQLFISTVRNRISKAFTVKSCANIYRNKALQGVFMVLPPLKKNNWHSQWPCPPLSLCNKWKLCSWCSQKPGRDTQFLCLLFSRDVRLDRTPYVTTKLISRRHEDWKKNLDSDSSWIKLDWAHSEVAHCLLDRVGLRHQEQWRPKGHFQEQLILNNSRLCAFAKVYCYSIASTVIATEENMSTIDPQNGGKLRYFFFFSRFFN